MYHIAQLWSPGSAGHKESNTNVSDVIVYLFIIDSFQLLILYFGVAGGREMGEEKDKKDSLSQMKMSLFFIQTCQAAEFIS